jgi:hypothetical protein
MPPKADPTTRPNRQAKQHVAPARVGRLTVLPGAMTARATSTTLVWFTFRRDLPDLAARALVTTLWIHPTAIGCHGITVQLPPRLADKLREGQHAPILAYARATKAYFDAVLRDTTRGLTDLEWQQYRLAIKLVLDHREQSRLDTLERSKLQRAPRAAWVKGGCIDHGGTNRPPLVGEYAGQPTDLTAKRELRTHKPARTCNTDHDTYQRQHAPDGYRWNTKQGRYQRKRRH